MKKQRIAAAVLALSLGTAQADPFAITYTSTIANSTIPEVLNGRVNLDGRAGDLGGGADHIQELRRRNGQAQFARAFLQEPSVQDNVGSPSQGGVLACGLIGGKRVVAQGGGDQLLDVTQLGGNAGGDETLAGVKRNGG